MEIAIKANNGKLKLNIPFEKIAAFLLRNSITILQIEQEHLYTLCSLELHHKDPFDRLIIAQGISQQLTILTVDNQFSNYPVNCFW